MSSKKQSTGNSQTSHKFKQASGEPNKRRESQKKVIHRGVFIADERRKGNNGRIKSTSLSNKIEVRMKRDVVYLHESEVEWVEIARYSKKQGRRQKKQEKKQQKYKVKEKQAGKQDSSQGKATVTKDQTQTQKYKPKQQQDTKLQQKATETIDKPSQSQKIQTKQVQTDVENQTQPREKDKAEQIKQQHEANEGEKQEKREEDGSSSSSDSEDSKEEKDQKQNREQQEQKQDKKQQDDIVIVAEIKSQISNPFWKKPFVGVLYFYQKKSKKSQPKYKQKQKGNKSDVSRILDDFDIDIWPIHARLPVCYISKTTAAEKMLEEYVEKNLKFSESDKGGKRRNMILDQFESTYALVRFVENYRGHIHVDILKIVGKAKTIDGECNCFLYEHELNDFEHQQLAELPKIQINTSPAHKRLDQLVFTIDPLTSVDLDDALSVKALSQSQYQFGIHISDVSQYLSKVPREELAKRTTSVYLPHNVFHMLPFYLTEICSLNPQVERVAFSVFVRINVEGEVLGSRLEKNIIKSRYKLAYQQAQGIIDGSLNYEAFNALHPCTSEQFGVLVEKLKIMQVIGMKHRKKRLIFQIFDNDEIKFDLDEQKWPISFSAKSRITSQKIIEQFMIIGNIQAAKKMTAFDSKNSLIIHHPPPSKLAIKQFNDFFQILDMKFKFEDSLSLQKDLMKVSNMENISQQIKQLCYFKARRVQQTASYKRFSEVQQNQGNIHFALGLRHYTHFTSPMRRIADIIVHETLNPLVDENIPKKQLLDQQIEQANWGRKNSKRLKKDLTEIYLCLMIYKTKKHVEADAIAVSFGCKSISIYIPLLDMSKEIMWKDVQVDKVFKNKQDDKKIDVVIYYDKRDSKGDIIWLLQKFVKFQVKIGCTQEIPLRLNFQFNVNTNKGHRKIKPK